MIKQLAHLCVHSKDLERTKIFYCDILGLEQKFKFYKEDKLHGFYINFGNNTFLEVFYNANVQVNKSIIQHFCLEVTNLDNIIQILNKNGFKTTEKQLGKDNSWQTWVTDPNGIVIELHEYTDQSSQLTGVNCEVNW